MTIKDFYRLINEDYTEVLGRLMNERIVTKFVCKFVQDPTYSNLEQALQQHQAEEAFIAAHTLKGLCLNLGFSHLGKIVSDLTELLRPKDDTINSPIVSELSNQIRTEYQAIIKAIALIEQ